VSPIPQETPKPTTSKKVSTENPYDLPDPEDDEEKWLTYRQRVQDIIELFEKKEQPCDTSRAGAILGLRELMGNEKIKKW